MPVTTDHPSIQRDPETFPICSDCDSGPLASASFKGLMEGEEVVYQTTKERAAIGMDTGCGLCSLLLCQRWPPGLHGSVPVRLSIRAVQDLDLGSSDSSWIEMVSPERVQVLSIILGSEPARYYYIYTSTDDPSAAEVVARNPILEVSSSRAYELARKALDDCATHHERCPKPRKYTTLPTRVIDCEDPLHPRLFVSEGKISPYVALSYVWGGDQPYRTIGSNLATYIKEISPRFIPQTIRDAIDSTHKLGLRYLWVDALCIIQDSKADKDRELVKMCQTYRDAYVTIIASGAASARAGFLHTRALGAEYHDHPQLPSYCRDGRVGRVFVFSNPLYMAEPDEPIDNRAWCLQERLLSPRKLVYGTDTIKYHCQTAQVCLGDAICRTRENERLLDVMFTPPDDPALSPESLTAAWTPSDWLTLHHSWRIVVENYTGRELSHEADKLVAFAGVAEEFHRVWASRAGRYLAGLWEHLLPHDLLWRRRNADPFEDPLRPRLTHAYAPSWSWASVDGPILPDTSFFMPPSVTRVLRCDVTLEDEKLPFGHVLGTASLRLHAPVVRTPWMVSPYPGYTDRTLNLFASVQSAGAHPEEYAVEDARGPGAWDGDNGFRDRERYMGMGSVRIYFDGSERVPASESVAIVFWRSEKSSVIVAGEGLIVADAGDGKYRRIAYWTGDYRGRDRSGRIPWIDCCSVEQDIELV